MTLTGTVEAKLADMPGNLFFWGMFLSELNFLMDLEREILLRKQVRQVELPGAGSHQVEAYALIWHWYDRLASFEFGVGEAKLRHYWQRCIDEENLSPSNALIRLVYVFTEGYQRDGIDIANHNLTLDLAQKHMAAWRERKARRSQV
ncbi:hypothetical protein TRP8649_02315 [Pelagimonas phthalicica]|uniref:Uncharacterized protein n=1 Tax=Pelagimonas phthalicica TaxID=1037362 RepID=A0A238JBY0_9RHOB|nr:hypothetical protein [Pelagimonas phthalicica]TDS91153.1 hypothetical protein CLV87_2317 [Pelagimonas phthalicica]SMX28200.1 hypothetical protein TRP8649_02315 [Pelagimonas phthalicica]